MVWNMRIGELARRAEVSRDTIRFYERHGLIRSEANVAQTNSYRDYPEEALMTLEVVRDAQAAGLSIAEITVFISQFMAQDHDGDGVEDFLDQRISEVRGRIAASERFLAMLEQTRAALARAPQEGLDEMRKPSS